MKKIISILFIIIGIGLILSPFINNKIIEQATENGQVIIEEITAEVIEENNKIVAEYDYDSIKDIEITSTISGVIGFNNKAVIGQIIIEDIDMNLPILKGVTNSNLMMGAATMVDGIEMGKGNYSLAGHYTKGRNMLFGHLMKIEKGSIVKLTDKKMIYEYEIYDTILVEETDFYMLDQSRAEKRGKPIVSLMSCYYTSKNGKRFFALGELKDEYPYQSDLIK